MIVKDENCIVLKELQKLQQILDDRARLRFEAGEDACAKAILAESENVAHVFSLYNFYVIGD